MAPVKWNSWTTTDTGYGRTTARRVSPPNGHHCATPSRSYRCATDPDSDIVHCRRPLAPDVALRFSLFFSIDPRFGLNRQAEYDLRMARRSLSAELAERVRVFRR